MYLCMCVNIIWVERIVCVKVVSDGAVNMMLDVYCAASLVLFIDIFICVS